MSRSDRASLEARWAHLVADPPHGLGPLLARLGLSALSLPYRLGLAANLALYDWRLKARTVPPLPVISVGNLSLGGTGKSTTVLYLARRLLERGVLPGVVTRGYGRTSEQDPLLVSDGRALLVSAAEAGDEPFMLATLLPSLPLAVGKRRERALALLGEHTAARVALLDDGFQYFRMRRLVDLVLLDASRARRGDRLFPAGYLREPWSHLRRADQVWLTHTDRAAPEAVEWLSARVRRYCRTPEPVLTRHRLTALRTLAGETYSLEQLCGRRVLAVAALGNPVPFEDSLREAGAEVTPCRYPDHYAYQAGDLEDLAQA